MITILEEYCVGCALCVPFCPEEAISCCGRVEISESCTECLFCLEYCPVGSLEPSEARKEIDLSIEDLRDLLPGFESHAQILMTGCYHGNWPAMFSIAGQAMSQKTPIGNLYAVGDGFISDAGMTAMVGAASSGIKAAKDITAHLKPCI